MNNQNAQDMEDVFLFSENSKRWENVSSNFLHLQANVNAFVEDFEMAKKVITTQTIKIDELQSEIINLQESLNTLEPFWQQIKYDMFDLKDNIKEKDEQLQRLRLDQHTQTRNFQLAQDELKTIKEALYSQSTCITTLSSTFGSLLWKASKEACVVHCIIAGNKCAELFRIVINSVKTFFDLYCSGDISYAKEQKQFIINFIGIISNVAVFAEGRQLLVEKREGKELIDEILNVIPKIPDSETGLRKIVLVTLFNISINKNGLLLIENNENLLNLLLRSIVNETDSTYISLKLLQSITYETENEKIIDFVQDKIFFEKLEELERKGIQDIRQPVTCIRNNIQYFRKKNEL